MVSEATTKLKSSPESCKRDASDDLFVFFVASEFIGFIEQHSKRVLKPRWSRTVTHAKIYACESTEQDRPIVEPRLRGLERTVYGVMRGPVARENNFALRIKNHENSNFIEYLFSI